MAWTLSLTLTSNAKSPCTSAPQSAGTHSQHHFSKGITFDIVVSTQIPINSDPPKALSFLLG